MDKIVSMVVEQVGKHAPEAKAVLIGVSGGADSMVLAEAVIRSGLYSVTLAHFNHCLRGDESDGDEFFVMDYAASRGAGFVRGCADVAAYCRENRVSTELGARELRRAFLQSELKAGGFDIVLLAHHADDQAETVLHNFIRGTGVRGLAGIAAYDAGQRVLRPLLSARKADILDAAKEYGLDWREDATNAGLDYDRCWLRNSIIPQVEERREGFSSVAGRSSDYFASLADFLDGQVSCWLSAEQAELGRKKHPNPLFRVAEFNSLHDVMKGEVLGRLWADTNGSRQGFSGTVVGEVNRWLKSPKDGSALYFGSVNLKHRNGIVYIA